jgi:hypothetical protein
MSELAKQIMDQLHEDDQGYEEDSETNSYPFTNQ